MPLVKLTGGQRIDLVGVTKEDLPNVWRDLDMPSGYACGKSYRTCKSCIGTDYCRFGLGDSMGLAQQDRDALSRPRQPRQAEARDRRLPAQLLRGAGQGRRRGRGRGTANGRSTSAARPARTCARAICCAPSTARTRCCSHGRFMQYYRENANYLERTYAFVAAHRHRSDSRGGRRRQRGHRRRARCGDAGVGRWRPRSLERGGGAEDGKPVRLRHPAAEA